MCVSDDVDVCVGEDVDVCVGEDVDVGEAGGRVCRTGACGWVQRNQ